MNPHKRELLAYLHAQKHEPFTIARRIDARRRLDRDFPRPFPLLLSLQSYPSYKRMVGENWMHWHEYYELWVSTDGTGEYRCGNHVFPFGPGDVVLVDPLKIHGVVRMDRAHAPLVLFFPAEAVVPSGSGVDLGFLAPWDRRPEHVGPRLRGDAPSAASVHAAVLRLAQAWFESRPTADRPLTLRFHLLELLMQLRRAFLSEGEAPGEDHTARAAREGKIDRILEYVARHCDGPLAQPEVARAAGMSTSRFRLFFKETTGWGFSDYLRDLRLERAARLLRETSESIAEVAYRTGFADQSHLQRLFKGKYSISPLAYRKRHIASE